MKKNKKKVGEAAAAAATVITGAAAVTVGTADMGNSSFDETTASDDADVAEPGELLVDGGILPEVEITGEAPMVEGGVLDDVIVSGTASLSQTDETPVENVPDVALEDVILQAEPVVQEAEPVVQEAEPILATAEAESAAVDSQAEVILPEPDFGEEFDDDDEMLAVAETTPGTIAEELLHKAEEKISEMFVGGAHTDEQDFQNMADASDFMYNE